jgi:hypothetical protein
MDSCDTVQVVNRQMIVRVPQAEWDAALAGPRGKDETPEAAARGRILGRAAQVLRDRALGDAPLQTNFPQDVVQAAQLWRYLVDQWSHDGRQLHRVRMGLEPYPTLRPARAVMPSDAETVADMRRGLEIIRALKQRDGQTPAGWEIVLR